jgi:very-short-patch-repair endonuclease
VHDKKRSDFLKKQGFKIVRFWNNEVNRNLEGVILKIEYEVNRNPLPPSPLAPLPKPHL